MCLSTFIDHEPPTEYLTKRKRIAMTSKGSQRSLSLKGTHFSHTPMPSPRKAVCGQSWNTLSDTACYQGPKIPKNVQKDRT